jgi:predicted Zn-dependent peptidase
MTKGTKKLEFPSSIISVISAFGSLNEDPQKAGLANVVAESYLFGTKKYPNPTDFFSKIEIEGGVFSSSSGLQSSGLLISAPKTKINLTKSLLDEALHNVDTTEEDLKKIKNTMKMRIDELESDDLGYAFSLLKSKLFKTSASLGSKESIDNITLDDVKALQEIHSNNSYSLQLSGSDLYTTDIPKDLELPEQINTVDTDNDDDVQFIDKDMAQNVVVLGYPISGIGDFDYIKRTIAGLVMSNSFYGLTMLRIREEHSAAYYAYSSFDFTRNKGIFVLYAGVSEENVVKATRIMLELMDEVVTGSFPDEMIGVSKKTMDGSLDLLHDSIDKLYGYYQGKLINGEKIMPYAEVKEKIKDVNKSDVLDIYKMVVKQKPSLVVNGKTTDDTKNKCKELLNNV